jgi:hypothetical protein
MGSYLLAALTVLLLGVGGGLYISVRQEGPRLVLLALAGPAIGIALWLLWEGA